MQEKWGEFSLDAIAMKLLVGLGNPGREYAHNRHNVGFMCLDRFAKSQKLSFNLRQSHSRIAVGKVAGEGVVLAEPRTFMNLSGGAVASVMNRYRVAAGDLLVVYDDMDLPLGTIRLREQGSAGGHKGVASIIAALGRNEFPRLRVGIGRPGGEAVNYVLGDFSPEERKIFEEVLERVSEAIVCYLSEGFSAAMNKFNRSPKPSL